MSGWIKLEKALETDPRVLRMAKVLARRWAIFDTSDEHVSDPYDPCNASALPGVTLVYGALARLWVFADSHVREDDTLDMGAADLDDWLGLPGFCAAMPSDWLRIIDENTVELPGFQAHNGVEAKKRALTQKRVAQHRAAPKRTSVTARNAHALPDQDQDQTKTRPEESRARESETTTEAQLLGFVERLRAAYPKRAGRVDWLAAERACRRLVESGVAWSDLESGTARYATYCDATGNTSTQYVLGPEKFYGAEDRPWAQPWSPPEAKPDPAARAAAARTAADAAQWERLRERAAACGFRAPSPIESCAVYETALRLHERDKAPARSLDISGLVAAKRLA